MLNTETSFDLATTQRKKAALIYSYRTPTLISVWHALSQFYYAFFTCEGFTFLLFEAEISRT